MTQDALFQQIREGFSTIPLPETQREQALTYLKEWYTQTEYAAYKPQLDSLIEKEAWSVLLDSFYRVLPFGTGGRRGAVGIGPNRINPMTIASSVQGHVLYLMDAFPNEEALSVVIAYDVRCFHDLRGHYDADKPNPLLMLTSKDLAHLAAEIYAANGIKAYLLNPELDTYISTPELSFLIRHFKAEGGLNISASHNHPDDNGGKFYNANGGQPVAPHDQQMSEWVEKVEKIEKMPLQQAVETQLVEWIEQHHRDAYIELNYDRRFDLAAQKAIIAYTPMHGTGSTSVGKLIERAGYELHMLASQTTFDGTFENVRYRIPNPEVPASMQDAIELAKEVGADLVLGTDPDADRIGLAAPDKDGTWRCFTGNEIAALVTRYLFKSLKQSGRITDNPIVLKTEVTSDLVRRITEADGGTCVGNLLVGFKYIGDALLSWEQHGEFLGVKGTPQDFVLGTEESHGFLTTPDLRDKDAAGVALYLVELASQLKSEGRTFPEELHDIHKTYGYFNNRLTSMVMEGAAGIANIRNLLTKLREQPPTEIAGRKVLEFFDHQDESGRFGPIRSQTDASSRNVLVFHLEGNIRLILRPSGTEPKAKLYIEVSSDPGQDETTLAQTIEQVDATAARIGKDFAGDALGRIGIQLPDFALQLSDLVSIDNKRYFGETVIPAWKTKLEALGETPSETQLSEVSQWLKEALARFGSTPNGLVAPGVEAYIAQLDAPSQHFVDHMRQTFQTIP